MISIILHIVVVALIFWAGVKWGLHIAVHTIEKNYNVGKKSLVKIIGENHSPHYEKPSPPPRPPFPQSIIR